MWSRLALLATTLSMALGALVLSLAWLWPQAPSRIIEVPLDTLEVGVPQFIRPFDMGGTKGHAYGIWLVRSEGNAVTAFWSAVPHPNACGVDVAEFGPVRPQRPQAQQKAVPTPRVPPRDLGGPPATLGHMTTGFRDPCHGMTYLIDETGVLGPTFRGLDSFPVTIEGSIARVDTSKRVLGPCRSYDLFDLCSTATRTVTIRQRLGS